MPSDSTKYWKAPLLWMAVALLLRFAYLAEQQHNSVLFYQPLLDEQEMVESARQLLAGKGFGTEPLFKAPLYPAYLAGVMTVAPEGWFWLARAIQHLLGALLVLLAYDTARRLPSAPNAKLGRIAGAVAAAAVTFYGPLIRLENSLILDFFTVFLQSAMLWALVRLGSSARVQQKWKWVSTAGVLAMLAWLNRPTLLPVLPFLALWIVGLKRFATMRRAGSQRHMIQHFKWAALFILFPVLGMGAFYWRNASVGEAMLLPWQGGYNFFHANKRGASGRYLTQENFSMAQSGNPTRELAESGYESAVKDGVASRGNEGGRFHAINSYWFNRGVNEIKEAPAAWLGLMGRKAIYLTTAREVFNFEDYDVQKELSTVLRWLPINFGVVWPLAFASIAVVPCWQRGRRKFAGLMWLYLFLLGGAIALYFTSGRLRMPLVFPAIVLAASGLGVLFQRYKTQRPGSGTAIVFAVLLSVGAAFSWADWWRVRSENLRHLEYARLSNAAWRGGKPDLALKYADLSEQEHPGYPTVPLLRGQALYNLGKMSEAAAAFSESLKRLPGDPVAPFNLGIIAHYYENQPDRAPLFFEEALRRQPDYHRAAWMSALAHLRRGEIARAEARLNPYLPVEPEHVPQLLSISAIALKLAQQDSTAAKELAGRLEKAGGEPAMKELADELRLLKLALP